MSILFLARGLDLPSQLWMRRQLDGLSSDVTVLASTTDSINAYRGRYKLVPIRESHAPLLWRATYFYTMKNISRTMKSSRVTSALVHFLTDAVLYRKALQHPSKPVYVHCHGYDVTWDLHTQENAECRRQVHRPEYVEKVRNLPANFFFIANSEKTARRLADIGIREDRVHLKYLGVEIPKEFQQRPSRTSGLTILYLGRLVDFKGPDLVIRAFERACQKGFDGRLIMAGDGPLALPCELLRAHSPWRDQIELLGAVDSTTGERLRREADIFTAHNCTGPLSGQEEAFGVSLVEAMASGLPIVNTPNGSVPEVVQDGAQGILVEPGDIDAHAEALVRLAGDPDLRFAMGNSGWQRAGKEFTLEREICRLREILGIQPGRR